MNDKQSNKLRMFRKVKGVFTDNAEISTKYPPIGSSFESFDGLITKIEKTDSAGATSTTGTFESKIELKESVANEAVELASAASVYARDKGDTELLAVLDVNFSEIRFGDDQGAFSLASAVYKELQELDPAAIEGYMITAEDLANFKTALDLFHVNLESTNGQDSVARNRQLAGLFKEATDHLNEHLDKLMRRISRKELVFFDTYTNARVIHDLGGRSKPDHGKDKF